MLYGSIGIPLLLITLARTGNRLARNQLNTMLYLDHYCCALPNYYLCNVCLCFRWICWLCCCCCCCLCCWCLNNADTRRKKRTGKLPPPPSGNTIGKRKEQRSKSRSGNSSAPILRLAPNLSNGPSRRNRPQATDGATCGTNQRCNQIVPNGIITSDTAFIVSEHDGTSKGAANKRSANDVAAAAAAAIPDTGKRSSGQAQEQAPTECGANELYSFRVFATSVTILLLYTNTGAYLYSRSEQIPFTSALFTCYSMLTGTELADPMEWVASVGARARSQPPNNRHLYAYSKKNPIEEVYESHLLNPLTVSSEVTSERKSPMGANKLDDELHSLIRLAIVTVYLAIGLNLISMCAHYARLWLERVIAQSKLDAAEDDSADPPEWTPSGGARQVNQAGAGTYGSSSALMIGSIIADSSNQQQLSAAPNHFSGLSSVNGEPDTNSDNDNRYSKQPQQIDLSELYVLGNRQANSSNSHQVSLVSSNGNHNDRAPLFDNNNLSVHSDSTQVSMQQQPQHHHQQVGFCAQHHGLSNDNLSIGCSGVYNQHHTASNYGDSKGLSSMGPGGQVMQLNSCLFNQQPSVNGGSSSSSAAVVNIDEHAMLQPSASLGHLGAVHLEVDNYNYLGPSIMQNQTIGRRGARSKQQQQQQVYDMHLDGCPANGFVAAPAGTVAGTLQRRRQFDSDTGSTSGNGTGGSCEQNGHLTDCGRNINGNSNNNTTTASTQLDLTLTASNTSNTMSSISSRVVQQQVAAAGAAARQKTTTVNSPRISFVLPNDAAPQVSSGERLQLNGVGGQVNGARDIGGSPD